MLGWIWVMIWVVLLIAIPLSCAKLHQIYENTKRQLREELACAVTGNLNEMFEEEEDTPKEEA